MEAERYYIKIDSTSKSIEILTTNEKLNFDFRYGARNMEILMRVILTEGQYFNSIDNDFFGYISRKRYLAAKSKYIELTKPK